MGKRCVRVIFKLLVRFIVWIVVLFMEMITVGEEVGLRGSEGWRIRVFFCMYVKFGIFIRYLIGYVEKIFEYTSLEFWR